MSEQPILNAKAHVLLVSAQAAPNLLPAFDPESKPKEAILLVSRKMSGRADGLEKVLRAAGVKTFRREVEDEHDFTRMQDLLLNLASERPGESIALNLTGGTKLMALAAQSVAAEAGWPCFYVDVDTDEILLLGNSPRRRRLAATMNLREYLRGYGFESKKGPDRPSGATRNVGDLLDTLLLQVGSLERPIGELNWLAQLAEERGTLDVRLTSEQLDSLSLNALLRHFQDAGALVVQGDSLSFSSEADRGFAKGGWLELHAFRTVARLADDLAVRDKAASLTVRDESGVENELDVAFMARNRLFVIEAKTARMDKGRAPKANDALFKLSEIYKRVGGLGTRGMFATYRALGGSEEKLARALNLEVVQGRQLARLDEAIKRWVWGRA